MAELLVTGGAGFIGANFVHYWREHHPDDTITVLDALTYAGNPANIAGLEGVELTFVQGDISRHALWSNGSFRERGIAHDRPLRGGERTSTARSAGRTRSSTTNVIGTHSPAQGRADGVARTRARRPAAPLPPCLDRRGLRLARARERPGLLRRRRPMPAEFALLGVQGGESDHLVRAYHHTFGLEVTTSNCSNNYGPYQFPEKLIPLMLVNILHGKPLPVYGDGMNVRDWLYVEDHCRGISRCSSWTRAASARCTTSVATTSGRISKS
jgi:dTDP-glucose 4,6-dehydratase